MSFSGGEVTLVNYFYELVDHLEKNFKKLAKNILFIVCCLLWFTLETLLSETFSISKLMDYQLISVGDNAEVKFISSKYRV